MKVSAHQPQFMPWAGFWNKYAQSDVMILMPNVSWDKGQTSNRVKIFGSWLTVPVKVPDSHLLKDVAFEGRDMVKVAKTFQQRLMNKQIPYRERLTSIHQTLLAHTEPGTYNLVDLNIRLLQSISQALQIPRPPMLVVDWQPMEGGSKTARLENLLLRSAPGITTYLSGMGGKSYMTGFKSPIEVHFCEGNWPDCSVAQLIAQEKEPLSVILKGY